MSENDPVLLLTGPQHYDKRRSSVAAPIKRHLEWINPLGIAIVARGLHNAGVTTHWETMPPEPGQISRLGPLIGNSRAVFISTRHFEAGLAAQAIEMANQLHKPVVVGGYGPTFTPDVFRDATSLVKGEGEPILDQLIEDLKRGNFQPEYDTRSIQFDMRQYLFPDRSIFRGIHSRLPGAVLHPIEWQRGCESACNFCAPVRLQKPAIEGGMRVVRERPVANIIAEIEQMGLKPGDNLFSVDLNTMQMRPENLRELFTYLRDKGIHWYTEGTIEPLLDDHDRHGPDESLLSLMAPHGSKGGCYSFLYGADDLIRNRPAGSVDKENDELPRAVDLFRQLGIPLNLSAIVGLQGHTYPNSFFAIAQALKDLEVAYTYVHIATPYPGTPFGDLLERIGRIFDHVPMHYNHRRPVAHPPGMTAEQPQQGYYWLQKVLNTPREMARVLRANRHFRPSRFTFKHNVMLSGAHWRAETLASHMELMARGYIDKNFMRELDSGFADWQSRSN